MKSPWRTLPEAAAYLRYEHEDGSPDVDTCRKYLKREGKLQKRKHGRINVVHVDDLETCIVPVNGHKRPA